ncbi:MAG: hypothetical protein QOD74_494 [Variibacter sp.]|nr:hypothetical protein [Variibacter sp.]
MMLRPRDSYDQRLLDAQLDIRPKPTSVRWIHDVFGNCVAIARFSGRSDELRIESGIRLEHAPSKAPNFQIEEQAKAYPFFYAADELPDLQPFIQRQHPDPDGGIERWARQFLNAGRRTPTGKLLMTLTCAIRESFTYNRRSEPGTQAPSVTLQLRRGTCRDFALFMIEAVRSLGFAARFVSGYVYVPDRDGPERRGGGSTHAWCQVYLPGAGWIEFDPTNGIIGSRDLIRVAVARDPSQAVPLSGTYLGDPSDHLTMTVEVQVTAENAPPKAVNARARAG